MKLIYKGKFDGNAESIPHGEHIEGAVKFKEPETPKELSLLANGLAFGVTLICFVIFAFRAEEGMKAFSLSACICSVLVLFPHEILHAVCFKKEVYLYTNFKQGMLFVTGPETMSKSRFIFMSMLPNLVFGFLPFILFLIFPSWGFLGTFGAISIGSGCGDYLNVFNALTQMPKGSRTYIYQFNSYWYMP